MIKNIFKIFFKKYKIITKDDFKILFQDNPAFESGFCSNGFYKNKWIFTLEKTALMQTVIIEKSDNYFMVTNSKDGISVVKYFEDKKIELQNDNLPVLLLKGFTLLVELVTNYSKDYENVLLTFNENDYVINKKLLNNIEEITDFIYPKVTNEEKEYLLNSIKRVPNKLKKEIVFRYDSKIDLKQEFEDLIQRTFMDTLIKKGVINQISNEYYMEDILDIFIPLFKDKDFVLSDLLDMKKYFVDTGSGLDHNDVLHVGDLLMDVAMVLNEKGFTTVFIEYSDADCYDVVFIDSGDFNLFRKACNKINLEVKNFEDNI